MRPFRSYRLENGNAVYAVQSDNHLYSLADKGKNLVIDIYRYEKEKIDALHDNGRG